MCGLTGFLNYSKRSSPEEMLSTIKQMSDSLVHRGPDDSGSWIDPDSGIALGHRRLSIVDLSPEGHQPMLSVQGRYVIAFNGEIYNFPKLRDELQRGCVFRGHSDTEVMLSAIEEWGLENAVNRFVGMFAFALWDRRDKVLYLCRDRMGEKPLYYGWVGDVFLFGSELKSLRSHTDFEPEINRDALSLYIRHNYIPAPHTVYKGIYKLLPGTILSLPTQGSAYQPEIISYWSVEKAVTVGAKNQFAGNEIEAIAELDKLLRDSISQQMVADVPLGAFLSGGIDSTTIASIMQAQSADPIKTFTIGFHESAFNEAEHAKEVARHLGTDHTELYVTPQQAMDVIPKLPTLYDEPFSDSSQIPTYLVSKLARNHVTVTLSGDGGDELFCGYNRYFMSRNIWSKLGGVPVTLRQLGADLLTTVSPQAWNRTFARLGPILPKRLKQHLPGDKIHKLAEILSVDTPEHMYLGLVSHWKNPESIVLGSSEPKTPLTNEWLDLPEFEQRLMYLDMMTYLPDDILVKVDRASMGVSLESRIPLLDHRIVEFASTLPMNMKIRDGQSKWLLRQVLYKYVPKDLIERPKMGFSVPIDQWLRGPLRDWAEGLLDEKRLHEEGFFNPLPIRQKWNEHLSGNRNWHYHLWDILMFQAWLEHQKNL